MIGLASPYSSFLDPFSHGISFCPGLLGSADGSTLAAVAHVRRPWPTLTGVMGSYRGFMEGISSGLCTPFHRFAFHPRLHHCLPRISRIGLLLRLPHVLPMLFETPRFGDNAIPAYQSILLGPHGWVISSRISLCIIFGNDVYPAHRAACDYSLWLRPYCSSPKDLAPLLAGGWVATLLVILLQDLSR